MDPKYAHRMITARNNQELERLKAENEGMRLRLRIWEKIKDNWPPKANIVEPAAKILTLTLLLASLLGCQTQAPVQPLTPAAIMPPAVQPVRAMAVARVASVATVVAPPVRTLTLTASEPLTIEDSTDLVHWQTLATLVKGESITMLASETNRSFRGVMTSISVGLRWDPSMDSAVTGYKIYVGGASHSYSEVYDVGNVTNCVVRHTAWLTNYYAATTYDASGMESDFSNEAVYPSRHPILYLK